MGVLGRLVGLLRVSGGFGRGSGGKGHGLACLGRVLLRGRGYPRGLGDQLLDLRLVGDAELAPALRLVLTHGDEGVEQAGGALQGDAAPRRLQLGAGVVIAESASWAARTRSSWVRACVSPVVMNRRGASGVSAFSAARPTCCSIGPTAAMRGNNTHSTLRTARSTIDAPQGCRHGKCIAGNAHSGR